jgi:Skp family chaperone for outer membrane proteins
MKKTAEKTTKKKNLLPIVALLIAGCALGICIYSLTLTNRNKVACIDTAKVLKAYKGIEELSKKYEEKNKLFKARLDTLAMEFQNSLKEFEKKRASLSEKERKIEEDKLRKQQEDYAQFNSGNQENLKQEEMKVIEKAVERINAKINTYAKKMDYAAVFGATPNSSVIYASNYVDITNAIIEVIND